MTDPTRPVTGYPAPPYAQPNGGYPYSANPTQTQPRGPYSNAYNPRAAFIRRFVGAMIALFVIVGCILLVVWLILRPKVPDFRVDSLSLSNFNVSSASQSVTGTWSVGFMVYNPNKKLSIRYDDVESSIYYGPGFISGTRVPPFAQGTKDRTSVNATFSAANSFVGASVARGIDEARARGSMSFNVKLLARVEFRRGWWRLRRRLLRVLCSGVAVSLSSKGGLSSLAGGSRDCQVVV
ncbi:hypothetical protein PRUPE_6G142400 [Prunus persica]|uniref:Late embryogenesis abundant protein LEA-2 subgroup domain-containing protein n=1 Tax=Prunus persica TaxID=3760 RepID=A0A251NQ98_PRUPE|nr:NDR1/HIN1-like protein 10 [Prunus persica]XP_020422690.1 NDR1/HIN1-like protein 10 [Prunus persica]XP_020422691.1 NDR1/HIN1-like protein 10 [Prunus persica]ONI01485.1 hypothetical protein PRUPE_6G142400 [Prunus persica]ONI01486.1 hypothetical protein PRUPE_6G142400 [Prunus persica]